MPERLQKHGELCLDNDLKEKLTTTSAITIKQLVKNSECRFKKMTFRKAPSRANNLFNNLLKAQIPIKRILPWDICIPGHFAVDTVCNFCDSAHCIYAYTIQLLDAVSAQNLDSII